MKHLRKFETEAEKNAWREGDSHVTPNVVLTEGVVDYNVSAIRKGVFIQHIDGKLYTKEGWTNGGFSNDEANGVAVCSDNAQFVVAKAGLGTNDWSSSDETAIDGIMLTSDSATAKTDFAGYNNTQLMLATDTYGAGYSCAKYTFPNGQKGYLPALGELNEAYANKSAIDSLMTIIGGESLANSYHWSSTQYSSTGSWVLTWFNGDRDNARKSTDKSVHPFTTLNL